MSADYVVDQKVRWSFVDDVTSPLTRVKQMLTDTTNLVNGSVNPTKVLEDAMRMLGTSGSESINKVVTDAKALQSEMTSIPKDTKLDITANTGEAIDRAKQLGTNIKELPKDTLVKVNATTEANKILDFKKDIGDVPTSHNTNLKVTDEVTEPLTHVRSAADETTKSSSKLHDVLMGTFAGSVIASGTAALLSGLHEATKAGMEYNVQQDTMRINWHNLTTEAPQDGKQLVGFINDMSQHSIYSSEALDKMAQSFYHVHSNAQETKKWTQDFVNLGSTLHVSNDALAEAGEQFAKIDAGGKANAEDMSVMINRFPMFGEALQKATGKSMDQLYQMSAQGKLTGKVFEEALDELGNKYKSSQAEALTSFQGMSMYLQSRTSMLFGDIEKSSFNMSKSALKDLQSLTSDKSMEQYANLISGGLSKVMEGATNVLSYIAAHRKDILAVISDISEIIGILAKSIWSTVSGIVKDIASAFGLVSDSAKKSGDPLKQIESALDAILKHKSAIQDFGKILVAAFAVKKITGFINGLSDVEKAFKSTSAVKTASAAYTAFSSTLSKGVGIFPAFGAALKAVPFTIWITAISTIVIALIELYKHNAKFREFVNGIADVAKKAFGELVKVTESTFSAIGKFFTGKLGWEQAIGKEISNVTKTVSSGFNATINWFKKNWAGLALLIVNPFAGGLKLLYDNNAGFRKWADDLIKGIINALKPIGKGLSTIWNGIKEATRIAFEGIKIVALAPIVLLAATMVAIWKGIQKPVEAIWNSIKKDAQTVWQGISNSIIIPVENAYKSVVDWFGKVASYTGKLWSAIWSNTVAIWNSIYTAVSKPVAAVFNFVSSSWQSVENVTSKVWNALLKDVTGIAKSIWSSVVSNFTSLENDISSIWNDIKKWTSDAWSALVGFVSKPVDAIWDKVTSVFGRLSSWIGNTLGSIKSTWHDVWTDVGSFFGGIWDGIEKSGKAGINGVIGFLNGGINGIDSVISFLGGSKKAIGDIPKLASGTMNGRLTHETFAILNDGHDSPETGNKEMIVKQNGQVGIVQGKDTLTHLDAGDAVINAHDARNIMYGMEIPHFATGSGWLDNIKDSVDWVGDKFDDVGKWIGDKAKSLENFVKNPVGEVTKVFDKFTSGFKQTSELVSQMAAPAGHFVIKQGEQWFKKLFGGLNDDQGDGGGHEGSPSGSGVQRWRDLVEKGLDANHLSTSSSMIDRVLRQIATESGGNNNAKQPGADPDGDGSGPALGLMQTKMSTFLHYAFPDHKDVWNGYDDILAGLAYAKATYGPSLSFLGNGHGYATGGHPTVPQVATIAEYGDEFVVNPRMSNAMQLINEAYERTVQEQPQLRDATRPSATGMHVNTVDAQSDENHSGISTKLLDTIIERLTEIRDKDDDAYLDGEKVTKITERVSAGQYRMAEAQGQA